MMNIGSQSCRQQKGYRGKRAFTAMLALALVAAVLVVPAPPIRACIGIDGTVPSWHGSKPNPDMVAKIQLAHTIAKLNGRETPTIPPIKGNHPTVIILVENAAAGASFSSTYRAASNWSNRLKQLDNYYNEVSRGILRIVPAAETHGTANDGVIGPVTVPLLSSSSIIDGDNSIPYAVQAIIMANPYINFMAFDKNHNLIIEPDELHILIYMAGYESSYTELFHPRTWAHNMYGSTGFANSGLGLMNTDGVLIRSYSICGSMFGSTRMATQGAMTHELGHDLGLPDLYDTDGTDSGGKSAGLGKHCLMASGSWGGTDGDMPTHIDAYYKNWLGWENQITRTEPVNAVWSLAAAKGNNTSLKITKPSSNEFFVIENRQQTGFDAGLPGAAGGLIIYHCDGAILNAGKNINDNPNNRGIAVEQANGSNTLYLGTDRGADTDYFRAGNKTVFDNTSTPNSKLKNGTPSGVNVWKVGAAGPTMTFNVGTVPPVLTYFRINNDTTSTAIRLVALNNTSVDGVPTEYLASESNTFSGAAWKPWTPSAPLFTIGTPGNGTKIVYFKTRNAAGESNMKLDAIYLREVNLLAVSSSWTAGAINPAYDYDWFKFSVASASTFAIETLAGTLTDNVVTLYGPNSETTQLAQVDDVGLTKMARIVTKLAPGTYYLKVQAKVAGTAGSYSIRVINLPPPAISSFSINSGAATTGNRKVILNNACTGSPTQYMASEFSSFSGAAWTAYGAAPVFTIASAGDGVKTVWLKVKGEGGESVARYDTIRLSSAAISALLVYKSSSSDIQAFATLLKARGINATLARRDDLTRVNLTPYQLIILGNESGGGTDWGTQAVIDWLVKSGKPILGLGQGGYAFFGRLGLKIGYPNGWTNSQTNLRAADATHVVFRLPYDLVPLTGGTLPLYSATSNVGIYLNPVPAGLVPLGRETVEGNHYTLISQGNRMLWGFTGSPATMTETGKALFENVVRHVAGMGTW